MMRVWIGLLLTGLGLAGQTPDVFVVPGEVLGSKPEVTAYSSDPFSRVATIPTQPYVRYFLAHPDGTRFYAISRLGPDGVRVISATPPYAELKRLPVVDTAAVEMSPDGRRMVLLGSNNLTGQNTVTILDLQTDTVAAKLSIPYNIRDQVAIAADSSRAYFLTISPGLLYAVDLTTNTLAPNPLWMPVVEAVRVGPNGLVYAAANRYLLEIDGRTLTPWDAIEPLGGSRVTGVELTRDGEYAITNGALTSLKTRKSTPIPSGGGSTTELGARRAFVGNTDTTWTGGAVETISQTLLPRGFNGVLATHEFPAARYVFGMEPRELRRYRMAGSLESYETLAIEGWTARYHPTPGAGTPASIVGIQTAQTVRRSDNPKPLVAKVLNAVGKPLANIAVAFESTLVSTSVRTDFQGNAVLNLPAGYTPGRYTVTARAGGLQAVVYEVNIEEDPGGSRHLTVLTGAGQFQSGNPYAFEYTPIRVQLRDGSGRPRAREAVRFAMRQNLGTLGPVSAARCDSGGCTVITDAEGYAAIDFVPRPELHSRTTPILETIVASSGGASVEVIRTILPAGGRVAMERVSPVGGTLNGIAGESIPGGFRARVFYINRADERMPLAAIRVAVDLNYGGFTPFCEGLTDADGYMTCDLQFPATPGQWKMVWSIGSQVFYERNDSILVNAFPNKPVVELKPIVYETGAERTFELSAFRPGAETSFGILNVLINSALDARRACYVAYSLAEERLYLVNDEGPAAGLSAPLVLGGGGSVSNGQCTVLGTGSSLSGTSSRPVLRLRIRFAEGFGGARLVQIAARTRNDAESSGWQTADVLRLPSPSPETGLRVDPMSQSVYLASTSQPFTFTVSGNGASTNVQTVWGLIGSSFDAGSGCVFAYYAPGNLITLYPDNGVPTGAMVPFQLGERLENSRCQLEPIRVDQGPYGLRLQLLIRAKLVFGGSKTIWGAASTLQNAVSPWTPLAAWQVQAPLN